MEALHLPRTTDELDAWRCPECGQPIAVVQTDLTETIKMGKTAHGSRMLAHGIDLGYPHTVERPVAYDYTFTCQNDHSFSVVRSATWT